MTLPKWIEPKVTIGNILTLLPLIGALIAAAQAYAVMGAQVQQNSSDISVLRSAIAAQSKEIADDRLVVRETLAEIKTDIRYLRRGEEERRRQEREEP